MRCTTLTLLSSLTHSSQDDVMTRTYKYVVHLREGFVELVSGVEAKGKAENEIRALQAQIDDVESRNSSLNTERIEGDLAQVKKENKALQAKIKAAK
jgi:peptidoglycan hydrolase CwlO-like protein